MANVTVNDIKFNVNIVNHQLTRQSILLGNTLKSLSQAIQAATRDILQAKDAASAGTAETAPNAAQKANGSQAAAPAAAPAAKEDAKGPFSQMLESAKKAGKAVSLPVKAITGVSKAWGALQTKISNGIGKIAAPFKSLFDSLFGAALKNAFAQVGSSILSAILSMRQMQTATGHLREGFSQMISPLVQAVTPALAALTNGLATVLAYAGRLFSFLTGKSVKSADAAAEAVSGVGSAAKGTAKATEQAARSLAGFDEIERLDAPKDSGGGGGGSSGGGTAAAETPAFAPFSSILEQMLDAIKNGKWDSAGALLAEHINGLVADFDADAFGRRLGTGIQHGLDLVTSFITGFQWVDLGAKLAEGANGLLTAIDFGDLGTLVAAKWTILIETIGGFLRDFQWADFAADISEFGKSFFGSIAGAIAAVGASGDGESGWQKIGEGIAAFFANVQWGELAQAVSKMLGAMFGAALALMAGFLGVDLEQSGADIIAGILLGIVNAVLGLPQWLYDNVLLPFKDGICAAFGIASPSTVAAEWGDFIAQGLLQGLTNGWQAITAFFGEKLAAIRQTVQETWEKVSETTSQIWDGIRETLRGAVNGIIGFLNRLLSGAADMVNGLVDILNRFSINVPADVPLIGGTTFGFSLGHVTAPQIPALAQGAVLPPNREFLAVLGDQRHGTNIEAPLETIQEAVRVELQSQIDAMMAGFEAVVAAIQNKDMDVYIGDESIGRAAGRWQQRMRFIEGSVY